MGSIIFIFEANQIASISELCFYSVYNEGTRVCRRRHIFQLSHGFRPSSAIQQRHSKSHNAKDLSLDFSIDIKQNTVTAILTVHSLALFPDNCVFMYP